MRRTFIVTIACIITLGCSGYQANIEVSKAKVFPPERGMRIAVLPFAEPSAKTVKKTVIVGEQTEFTADNAGTAVADAISSALMTVPNIALIERSKLERILDENKFSLSGLIEKPDFVSLGKILPVDGLVLGTVTTYSRYQDRATWGGTVAFSARLVNIHSGEVLFMMSCSRRKIYMLPEKVADDLSREAVRKLLEK
jgi:hypothetical protein